MKLNELQLLLLSELANTGLLQLELQPPGSVMESVRAWKLRLQSRGQGELAESILASLSFADLEVRQQAGDHLNVDWVIFMNPEQQHTYVSVLEPRITQQGHTYLYSLEQSVHRLREELATANHIIFTGLGYGGWRAAELAEALDAEAVVFGVPTVEALPGKALNYLGEDDPVGDHLDKVVFVKQADLTEGEDEDEASLSCKLMFDGDGRAIVTEQSEFSKFVSWFYHTAGAVEPEVWKIFFPATTEEESEIMGDLGVYSVFLKVGELNREKLLRSIDETVRFIAGRLEARRSSFANELDLLPEGDYEERVSETAEKYTEQATEFILRMFESVQTVLMGVALFTLEQEEWDSGTPIDSLQVQIQHLLDQELERVKECLDQAIARRLENYFKLPEFNFEW